MVLDSDLLAKLYATAEEDARWMPALDQLCQTLDASSAVVQLLEEDSRSINALWMARDSQSAALSAQHDRWVNNAENPRLAKSSMPPPARLASLLEVGSDGRLFADDPAMLQQIRERISRAGLGQAFWASVALSYNRRFSLVLHRKAGDFRDLSQTEENVLRQLLPHLEQSVRLATRLKATNTRANALEHALQHIDLGMLLCRADLQVQWVNPAALELLQRSPDLTIRGAALVARSAADQRKLRLLVQSACDGATGSLIATLAQGMLHLRAIASYDKLGARMVSLYLSGPANPIAPCAEEIGSLFGLTPAEARLTAAIAAGQTLADYARETGVAIGTVRNQLKQVLSKTCTNRQADLVRLLSGSVLARTRRFAGPPLL